MRNFTNQTKMIRALALFTLLLLLSLVSVRAQLPIKGIDVVRCGAGPVDLVVEWDGTALDPLNVKWYTEPFYGTPFHTGLSYTTDYLELTTTFYVDYIDENLCGECDRLLIKAIIFDAIINNQLFYESNTFCNSASNIYFPTIVGVQGGSFSVQPVGGSPQNPLLISSETGAFNPQNVTAGTYTITYLPPDIPGCDSDPVSIDVTITDAPLQPEISYAQETYCGYSGIIEVIQAGASGGTYSASPSGLSLNNATGQINAGNSLEGLYTITYFVPAVGGCNPVSASTQLTINTASQGGIAVAMLTVISSGSSTTITLSGYNGEIQWQYSLNNIEFYDIGGATSDVLATGQLTEITYYRAVVTNGICDPDISNVASVSVSAASVAGTASATPYIICSGSNTTLSLVGYVGSIQWQSDETGSFVDLPGAIQDEITTGALEITTPGLERIVNFRAVVTEGLSAPGISNVVEVTIRPNPLPGLAIGAEICSGGDGAVHVFDYLGDAVQWQSSTIEAGPFSDIPDASGDNYTALGLTETVYYRAKISNDPCDEVYTDVVAITVSPPSVAGIAAADPVEMCVGGVADISLTGYTGAIFWEHKAPEGDWVYAGGSDNFTSNILSVVGTHQFRAKLTSGTCPESISNIVDISVEAQPSWANYTAPSATINYGESVTFSVSVENGLGGTITWVRSIMPGGEGITVTSPDAPPVIGTFYYRPTFAADGLNCSLNDGAEYTVVVNQKELTVINASVTTKTYDGNTDASITNAELSGLVLGDVAGVDVILGNHTSGTFSQAGIGAGISVATAPMTISGARSSNYFLTQPILAGEITALQLIITAPDLTKAKVYDGNTTAAVTEGTLENIVSPDVVTVSAIANYDNANVGTGKTITVVYTLDGAGAGNYIKPVDHVVNDGEITALQLTITAPDLTKTKVYDGNTTAAVTEGTLENIVSPDVVTVSAIANYDNADAGTGKTITVVYTLDGAGAGNYIKPIDHVVNDGEITALQLTITAPDLTKTKVYDGNTTAAVTEGTLENIVSPDVVTVSAIANYDNADAGTGKTITVVYTLDGAGAGNYIKPIDHVVNDGEITALQLTITAPDLTKTKVYDGNTTAAVTEGTLENIVSPDVVTVSAIANYDNADAGTGKTITVVYTLDGAGAGNYIKPVDHVVNDGEITALQLTITAPDLTKTKVYDGNTTAEVTEGTLENIVSPDVVTVSAVANYDNADAGTGKTITVVYTLDGAGAGNYIKPVDHVVNDGEITALQLTITAPDLTKTKVYDGNPTAAVTEGTLENIVSPDVVTVSAIANYDNANVGTGKTITVVYTLDGAGAGNYIKPVDHVVNDGEITALQLTITAPDLTNTKVYDGNTTATVTAGTLDNVISPDVVTVSAIANYDNANVGTGKTITVVYTLDGAGAGNYIKPVDHVVNDGEITALQLTITAPDLTKTKVYDGNTTAAVTEGTLENVVSPDVVTVSAIANYDNANVGTGKTITVVYTLDGAGAGNYIKPVDHVVNDGEITALQLTITAPDLTKTKVYDGNTTAAVTEGTLENIVSPDVVTVSAIANYDNANVGTGKTITVVYTLDGAGAGNYIKPVDHVVNDGEITALQLTITAPDLTKTKVYDGNTTAAVTEGTLENIVSPDVVTVSAVANYDNADAGTGKTITVVYTLDGAGAGNYIKPIDHVVNDGEITALQLTITAPDLTKIKVYDGNTTAAVTEGTLENIVSPDVVTVSAVANYDNANVGTGKTITVVYTLDGAGAGNYIKPVDHVVNDGEITALQLTITAPDLTKTKVYDGNPTAAVTEGTLENIVSPDVVTVSAVANYDNANVGTGKTITVVYTLDGAGAGNYIKPVDHVVNDGEITALQLTITAPDLTKTKVYDGNPTAAVTEGTLENIVSPDVVTVSAVANFDNANVGTGKTITVVYTLDGAGAGNYIKPVDHVVNDGEITALQLTIENPGLTTSKTYDGNTTAAVTAGGLTNIVGNDDVSINTTTADYDNANVGTGKTITVVYTITGLVSANYIAPANYAVTNGEITALQLTIENPGLTTSKTYDGNTTAAVTAGGLTNIVGNDDVSINTTTADYDNANVGTGKTITVVYTITGLVSANYIAPANYAVTNGEITALQLTISAPDLTKTKVYDGNTTAAVTEGTLENVVSPDVVTVSAVANYDNADAGTGKTITVVYTLNGAGAGNYIKPIDHVVNDGEITEL
jgi:hypothetical protein